MLIEHVYSDAARQFPTNIPDLISSDLTIPHTIFICDHYHFAARALFSCTGEVSKYPRQFANSFSGRF